MFIFFSWTLNEMVSRIFRHLQNDLFLAQVARELRYHGSIYFKKKSNIQSLWGPPLGVNQM